MYQKESTIQDLSSNGRDESNEMSDRYEHTAVYPTGFGALKPPTSYNSIQGKEINNNKMERMAQLTRWMPLVGQ